MNDGKRTFTQHSRSYYAQSVSIGNNITDEVNFGLDAPDGGTYGSMAMQWVMLTGDDPTPKLEVFGDAFAVLHTFSDVIAELAQHDSDLTGKEMTPDAFCALLTQCGFTDETDEVGPHHEFRTQWLDQASAIIAEARNNRMSVRDVLKQLGELR